ncbi:MAG TPA: MASE1 domain-containing protein [Candidatus Dormibacteraeota bacterium]|nr:MASE1 domain-containing protein [Candidatus Dormibacteraeota bacterium]
MRTRNVTAIRPTLLRIVVVAFVYWLAARASLSLALVHGQVTPIWPPTGIALVAILVFGRWMALGVYVGAFAVNLPIGPTPFGAALIAVGNTLAPVAAAELLNRIGFRRELDRLRDAAAIIVLAALVAMTLSATVGTSVLVLSDTVPVSNFWATWAVWWTGDAMGVMLVAPFLLSLVPRSTAPALTLTTGTLLAALLLGIATVTYVLFQLPVRLEYLVFPLIMIAAWRFRLRGATVAALIASGLAVEAAVQGTGPFAGQGLAEKMITLQVFNVFVAMSSFVLSAYVDARERAASARRMYEAAEAANRAKSEFLNMAAHELRTPITVLSGYLSMLGEGSLGAPPPAWETPISILATKTEELEKIVSDLLEASRLDLNQQPAVKGVVDLRQVVTAAVARLAPRAKLLSADVRAELPDDPMMVEANNGQLGRVLDNILNNALTYTRNTPEVAIRVTRDHGKALVRIEDNGIGIPRNERERVFERFFRSTDPMMAKVPGVGLGLYISRGLVESHGGKLVVERSDPKKGTVFALGLPLVTGT